MAGAPTSTQVPAAGAATLVQAVRAHGGEVACLDACGARLATGGGDRALRLWAWHTDGTGWAAAGEALHAHRYGVVALRWATGGALLASGGVDGAVRLWCGRSLAARRHLAAPGATAVRALCWAGGRLLAGHDDGALCVWAPAGGALVARFQPHEGALHALTVPARGALLLTACTHGVLKVFSLVAVCASGAGDELEGAPPPAPLQWVDGAHDLGALCADASEAGAAATGGHDARIRVWMPRGEGPLAEGPALEGHTAAVTALRWARAGAVLASASLDRTARLWAPAAAACLLVVAAHPRYLTCVALAPDLRYMITGSNDKTFRTWSLGEFSLDDDMEPPCSPHLHYALGDLQGIGPVEDDGDTDGTGDGTLVPEEGEWAVHEGEGNSGARRVWSVQAHAGPINCLATWDELLATASSDGWVKVWSWQERCGGGVLQVLHAVRGGEYPTLAADFGARGTVLLAAGLDGAATLYDVQSGVAVRAVAAPGGRGGEPGGGGVRGARLSPHRAPLALLATDDGLALLWRLTDPDPHPLTVYAGHTEAVTCCAWSADGRLAATGAASGELRVQAPPSAACLHHDSKAHDLGVLSCDFAPPCAEIDLEEHCYLLATGGCDSLVKLWQVEAAPGAGEGGARVRLVRAVAAHGGAVAAVRWGACGALATAGADTWARVWRVSLGAEARVVATCAVPVSGAGGAPAAALAARGLLLAVGSLAGELALWRLPAAEAAPPDHVAPRLWDERGVARWVRDYVVEAPGSAVSRAAGAALESRVRSARLTGTRLLDDPIDELLDLFDGAGEAATEESSAVVGAVGVESAVRACARRELLYVRAPPPDHTLDQAAPHALLCPLSHRLLTWPARAADGYTYERANLAEWVTAAGALLSPLSGRPLRSAIVAPNYRLLEEVRAFRAHHEPETLPPADGAP